MTRALVIGAGVVGCQVAIQLARRGLDTVIVDDRGPGLATSYGNAGCIAVAEITPISMPGLVWQVPRMLLDPLGPLSIRPAYLPRLAPWLWRFWRAARRDRVEAITAALGRLVGRAWTDWEPVIADAGLGPLVSRRGGLFVYQSEAALRAGDYEWSLRRANGVRAEAIGAAEIRALEPALGPQFSHGYFIPDWGHVGDPHRIVTQLADHFRALGGRIRLGRVTGFGFAGGRPAQALIEGGEAEPFDQVAVCGGAWSRDLAAALGHHVPLDTERGYNTTLPDPGIALSRPVCPAEGNFIITPMDIGLRIGGAVELAGLQAPPNFARARALLELGRRALPGLNTAGGREWMGFRPSIPDSMPVISASPRHANAFFGFGHGHMGLTESATTGRILADLMTGQPPPIDPAPFRIDRF